MSTSNPEMPTSGSDPLAVQASQAVTVQTEGVALTPAQQLVLNGAYSVLAVVACLLAIYAARHYLFTLHRMFARQRSLYAGIVSAPWPRLAVLVAAHNEEAVIADCISRLLTADYPSDRLLIIPMNDRSTDGTRAIIDRYADSHPALLRPFHRLGGTPGKAAALKEATAIVVREKLADVIVVFDADYLPGPQLLKQLAVPFLDPEVGAVMGRVVPQNTGVNLLTRLLDLERSAGYQVDQQARFSLGAVAQYGGTVGGVRLSALAQVGGWHENMLAEDTDLTYRLLLRGWRMAYLAHAECHEEVPQNWSVRFRQIGRWAKGHNQAMTKHALGLAVRGPVGWVARLDGLALLGVYAMAPMLLISWVAAVVALLMGGDAIPASLTALLALTMVAACGCLGNFAAFFEVAAAVHLDGHHARLRLMPWLLVGFVVSLVAVSKAAWDGWVVDKLMHRPLIWDKTVRYRRSGREL
ncbi:glycosyltransferase [Comamonas sp.]|uniref:glycosyltransferase family 2 protein n=1 Tax=Comamonas sp. TaxID=34028 RepID=UPI00289AAB0D|nr:glycosyltransferase [Comamonas sp.]